MRIFFIRRVKVRTIPYFRQLPIKRGNKVSVAKAVQPPLEPPAAFGPTPTPGHGIVLY